MEQPQPSGRSSKRAAFRTPSEDSTPTDPATRPPQSTEWHALGQGSLNTRIREEILRVLAERRLSPGDQLPSERQLAQTLRVSRPSVREAVRSLQAEGRLVVQHGRGVFVAEPAVRRQFEAAIAAFEHDLGELFAMREVLEVPAARWAAERHDRKAIAAVQAAYTTLEESLNHHPLNYDKLRRLDQAFHVSIVRATGNRLLEQTQGVLDALMRKGMQTTLEVEGRIDQSRIEHARILDALQAGDAMAAAETARAHVEGAREAASRRQFNNASHLRIS